MGRGQQVCTCTPIETLREEHTAEVSKRHRERETDDKDIDRGRDLVMETLQPLVTYSKKNV